MDIFVCMKQVPILSEIKVDEKKGLVIREGSAMVINPEDTNAIELAIELRNKFGGKITAISMGPKSVRIAVKEAEAMGVDDAIMLRDDAFKASDAQTTAKILVKAIKKLGHFDLILCGNQTLDGNTALVAPHIAEYLDLPQITYGKSVEINRTGTKIKVRRFTETKDYVYECSLPAVVSVTKEINDPHLPHMIGIYDAYEEDNEPVWNAKDLDIDPNDVGLEGSPTTVLRVFKPKRASKIEFIKGRNNWDKADGLVKKMLEDKLI